MTALAINQVRAEGKDRPGYIMQRTGVKGHALFKTASLRCLKYRICTQRAFQGSDRGASFERKRWFTQTLHRWRANQIMMSAAPANEKRKLIFLGTPEVRQVFV